MQTPNLLILLSDEDDISYVIRLLFFPDETGVYKLRDFQLNRFHYLWAIPSLLLHGLRIWINIEAMYGHLRIKLRHILIVPNKNIYILSHEMY